MVVDRLMWLPLVLLACGTNEPKPDEVEVVDEVPEVTPEPLPTYTTLDARDLLIRASMDLRGARPSIEEMDQIDADPDSVQELIATFVDDPRFSLRIQDLFADVYLTRIEVPYAKFDYFLPDISMEKLSRSVGSEPLQVLAHIVDNDLPYSEMVLGDWTMGNEVTARMWPLELEPGTGQFGWSRTRYTDGRPAAGVLSHNGLWWHYGSMENNLNRGRANAVSRILLCADYLDVEIDFGTDQPLNSEEALGDAIRTDPACASCHDTLDPLAAHFYGFWWFSGRKGMPQDTSKYHLERERFWMKYDGLPPAYMGTPTTGLADLGREIAADPRFNRCMVERSWELLMRRDMERDERPLINVHLETFEASELNVKALFRDIIRSDAYANADGGFGRKVVSPALLSSQVAQLTGFKLQRDGWDLLTAPILGFNAMAGGIDIFYRAIPLQEPSATWALVIKRHAESAGDYAATHDLGSANPTLFTIADGTETADDLDRVTAQVVDMHARMLTERVSNDDPKVVSAVQLWTEVEAAYGNRAAWASVVSLMIRDPAFLVY